MKKKQLLLGDEAIALGAINAGLVGAYAYPGTPSTEITEYIQNSPEAKANNVFCKWCANEKTAMETALGVSYVGRRSIVCMKHVGMNVAADGFVNGAMAGPNGGIVVVVADDPSMHSSQGEQPLHAKNLSYFVPALVDLAVLADGVVEGGVYGLAVYAAYHHTALAIEKCADRFVTIDAGQHTVGARR